MINPHVILMEIKMLITHEDDFGYIVKEIKSLIKRYEESSIPDEN